MSQTSHAARKRRRRKCEEQPIIQTRIYRRALNSPNLCACRTDWKLACVEVWTSWGKEMQARRHQSDIAAAPHPDQSIFFIIILLLLLVANGLSFGRDRPADPFFHSDSGWWVRWSLRSRLICLTERERDRCQDDFRSRFCATKEIGWRPERGR
ncbi:hypothetical protein LX32DRAFT_181776 [Colletotrichum zoysiae]|uniref:Uncharacterized protein n=1 Tax=Colletotrichum zoysiae TaxID=1216348 RepID=A0AAD9HP48_9PEZI|nr:hypothetical protein LX32DRAFT_181776 [Colletotrichum zoysiae]